MSKVAIKLLTRSDLTLFAWHFKEIKAVRQMAINLNAEVFVKKFYPKLPSLSAQGDVELDLTLSVYGPGQATEHRLQQKIMKGVKYKNWRLSGGVINDPSDMPERYNCLAAKDFAVMEFGGDVEPAEIKMTLVCAGVEGDKLLHSKLVKFMAGRRSMVALSCDDIANLQVGVKSIDAALKNVALNSIDGSKRRVGWTPSRRFSEDELKNARERANVIGREGERYVDYFLGQAQKYGRIRGYEWSSQANAIEAFDFKVDDSILVDVKSTAGSFQQKIHVSFNELLHMREYDYHLYRVYEVEEQQAKLRICKEVRKLAEEILPLLENLPFGIKVDSISIDPEVLRFGEEILIGTDAARKLGSTESVVAIEID